MDLVTEVEEWPYGIKFARWDEGTQVDWDWLKILEHLLAPGQEDSMTSFNVSQIFNKTQVESVQFGKTLDLDL